MEKPNYTEHEVTIKVRVIEDALTIRKHLATLDDEETGESYHISIGFGSGNLIFDKKDSGNIRKVVFTPHNLLEVVRKFLDEEEEDEFPILDSEWFDFEQKPLHIDVKRKLAEYLAAKVDAEILWTNEFEGKFQWAVIALETEFWLNFFDALDQAKAFCKHYELPIISIKGKE